MSSHRHELCDRSCVAGVLFGFLSARELARPARGPGGHAGPPRRSPDETAPPDSAEPLRGPVAGFASNT